MGEVGVCADWSPFHCTVVLGGPEVIEYWRRYYEGQDGIVSVWGSVSVRGGVSVSGGVSVRGSVSVRGGVSVSGGVSVRGGVGVRGGGCEG